MDVTSGVSNLNEAIELEQESDDHMTKAIHVGPSKPKPKWTRVPHMECGLRGLSAETSTTILGKRGPTQIEEDEFNEENEAQVSKHGKLQGDYCSNTAVGMFEHPCQPQ